MDARILKGDNFSSVCEFQCIDVRYRTFNYSSRTMSSCGFRILLSQ